MRLFLEISGIGLIIINGLWFFFTSMTDAYTVEGKQDMKMNFIKRALLSTFISSGIWISIAMWMVVSE